LGVGRWTFGVEIEMSEQRHTRSKVLGALAAALIVILFCFFLLWHNPLVFWNDDYELSVLPVFADVARSWSHGHFPLLSPYSWVCGNLAGEFQYGTFSIFVNAAVVLIWKFPLTFPQQAAALSITHLFVLASGAFLLAYDRLRGCTKPAATLTQQLRRPPLPQGEFGGEGNPPLSPIPLSVLVALVAALNGWIVCWGATDWFGALGAFAWLPWAWWALEKSAGSADHGGESAKMPSGPGTATTLTHRKRLMIRALWPAPFVYLVVTGGFPYTIVMLALLIVWLSIRALVETRSVTTILPMLAGVALGIGLSAPAWLALFDYVHGSAREARANSAHFQWLVPPAALPGLILPCWTVKWANFSSHYQPHTGTELACGLAAPAALIAGLLSRGSMLVRQIKWELALLLTALLLSMVPTIGVFRWSFRWLPFFHLVMAICAAEALRRGVDSARRALASREEGQPMIAGRVHVFRASIVALVLVALTATAMWIWHTSGAFAFPVTWILIAVAAIWVVADLTSPNDFVRAWLPAGVTLVVLLAAYLCIPTNGGVPRFNFSQQLLKPAPLDPQRLYLSIYPPPEWNYRVETEPQPVGQVVRPGSTSMWAGVRLINGYSPIEAAGVAREFGFATHGEIDPGVAESLLSDEAGADGLLARLGIDGIIVANEMDMAPTPESEWRLVFSSDEGRVYHRIGPPFARVRSISLMDTRPNEQYATAAVSQINESRNRVAADVTVPTGGRPALLTFSRPYFDGYQARLGDREIRVSSYRGLCPILELPAGSHGRLVLRYGPRWLIYGSAVAALSGAIWLFGIVGALRRGASGRVGSNTA
jgi:hypothetical protein